MSAIPKIPREPVAPPNPPERTDIGESAATLYTNAVERLAEVLYKGTDLALQQCTEVVKFWKKLVQEVPGTPGIFMMDLALAGFERYADTQKGTVDLIVEQNRAFADLVKERTRAAGKATEGAATMMQQTIERSVAAQKKALDHAAAHAKALSETAKQQFGFAGSPAEAAVESFQKGVSSIIEAQKEMLDLTVTTH